VWQNAQRDAMPPGADNPLFSGALGHWDGVILYSHPWVPIEDGTGSPALQVGDAVLFGSEALARVYGRMPEYFNESFDYGESLGTGISVVRGIKKINFDAVDRSVLVVKTACADPNA